MIISDCLAQFYNIYRAIPVRLSELVLGYRRQSQATSILFNWRETIILPWLWAFSPTPTTVARSRKPIFTPLHAKPGTLIQNTTCRLRRRISLLPLWAFIWYRCVVSPAWLQALSVSFCPHAFPSRMLVFYDKSRGFYTNWTLNIQSQSVVCRYSWKA